MILLDTHVIVWMLTAAERISSRAREAIVQARMAGERIGYSPVSLYEIAYAARRNRLLLNIPAKDFIAAASARLDLVPVTAEIAILAAELPERFHGDPMDRMIAATAVTLDCTLITRDEQIRGANVCKTLW
jgi:PIN domain nuclease of toxin-antitoxin system